MRVHLTFKILREDSLGTGSDGIGTQTKRPLGFCWSWGLPPTGGHLCPPEGVKAEVFEFMSTSQTHLTKC